MRIIFLGTGAGGGVPQWNCACPRCQAARARGEHRLQDTVAVSADGARWVLLNCSPDIHAQIRATPALWPQAPRSTPIGAIVLGNGDLDHVLGLLLLREGTPLSVLATAPVRRSIEENPWSRTLARFEGQLRWGALVPGEEQALTDADGAPLGLAVRPIAAPGKVPLHLEGRVPPDPADNVAIVVSDGRVSFGYASAVGALDPALREALSACACVAFDGSFFYPDELARLGLGTRTARDMAHLPVRDMLRDDFLPAGCRKLLTHVNNTNPLLDPNSPESRELAEHGWALAEDGQEVNL